MAHARVALAALVFAMSACAAAEPAPKAAEQPARSEPLASFQGTRWGTFHSKRFELSMGLPDGAAWKIDDHRSGWLRATHEPTRSALLVRSWAEDSIVTRKGCYARAREWEPRLPDLDAVPLIDDKMRPLLGSRDARVAVGVVVRGAPTPSTDGFVVGIAGDVHRCAVVVFQTEASGDLAQDEIADRLVIASDRLLPSMKLDQSFAPSREPAILPPGAAGVSGGVR
jgi:hypothetical protein